MRTLIYKRTHTGDPDPKAGVFGNHDCMKSIRDRKFDAVIGIGGIGQEPKNWGIDGRLNWIGIDPSSHGRHPKSGSRRLIFSHFLYLGADGPLLQGKYPALAAHMYNTNRRSIMHSPSPARARLDREVNKILRLAEAAPRSNRRAKQASRTNSGKCPPKSRGVC